MISDVPSELERWAKQEAGRRKQLGLPRRANYHVICDAIALLRRQTKPGKYVYYVDVHGPFYSTLEALDFLGVPDDDRGKYWYRWDRLPKKLADKIEVRDNPAIQEDGRDAVFERTHGSKGCDDNELPKPDGGYRHQWDTSSGALAAV